MIDHGTAMLRSSGPQRGVWGLLSRRKCSRMFYRVEQGLSKTRRDEIAMGPGMHEWAMGWPQGTDRYGYSYRYAAHE